MPNFSYWSTAEQTIAVPMERASQSKAKRWRAAGRCFCRVYLGFISEALDVIAMKKDSLN
jgi:hypothetical protein